MTTVYPISIPTSPTHQSNSPTYPPISNSDNTPLSQKRNSEQSTPIYGAIHLTYY